MIKEDFLKRSGETIETIFDRVSTLPSLNLNELDTCNTALIIIDMVNGFVREGNLKSPRIEDLIDETVKVINMCDDSNIPKIVFADSHGENSPEFDCFASHCLKGSSESEIVDEIKELGGYKLIHKNSTNGFLEHEFQAWLKLNPNINTFIIIGDCTDICIQQFSLTLKAWFNMQNKKSKIIVPENAVNTFDYDVHNGDLMHIMSLYYMISGGIEVVRELIKA